MSQCHIFNCPRPATGWLVSPSGRRVFMMCAQCADETIARFRDTAGQEWWFEPVEKDGGFAFPQPLVGTPGGSVYCSAETGKRHAGMTLWDYYAAAAITRLSAARAADEADIMLAERRKRFAGC